MTGPVDPPTVSAGVLGGRAHLYLAAIDEWAAEESLARSMAFLSTEERERHARFRVEAPARAFAIGRALARQVLSLYADVAPADWRLEPDERGRPRISGPREHPALEFNLSHNDRLVACVVTGGSACGVDVESPTRRVDPVRIAEHSFGEDETRDLKKRDGADRRRRFFEYWTLKEAYLKARGRGIEMRMDSVLFDLAETRAIAAGFAARVEDRPEDWQFALYRTEADQLVALALRRDGGADLEIQAFRSRPGAPRAAAAAPELARVSRPAVGAGA